MTGGPRDLGDLVAVWAASPAAHELTPAARQALRRIIAQAKARTGLREPSTWPVVTGAFFLGAWLTRRSARRKARGPAPLVVLVRTNTQESA